VIVPNRRLVSVGGDDRIEADAVARGERATAAQSHGRERSRRGCSVSRLEQSAVLLTSAEASAELVVKVERLVATDEHG
jgi:hypothetical protein